MKGISEKAFESQVKQLVKIFGWRYYHTWRSIHSPAGFPDCVMVRPPRLIFAELKSEDGKTTPEQEAWLEDLRECVRTIRNLAGREPTVIPEVYLWKPSQLETEIAEVLR